MAGEAPKYAAWVRTQECIMRSEDGEHCMGAVQAHHAGPRGYGQRAHDDTCVPLCLYHHDAWHSASKPFKQLRKPERREWAHNSIAWTRRVARSAGVSTNE